MQAIQSTHYSTPYWGPELPERAPRNHLPYTKNLGPSYVPTHLIRKIENPLEPSLRLVGGSDFLDLSTEDLKNHMETRIQLFFQQMLLFYKTGLHFQLYTHADSQVGKINGDGAAAHSSTLPTLRLATNQNGTSVCVAHGSSFYYDWNTTVYLPTIANHVDLSIDQSGLRKSAINILNSVSLGLLQPGEGLSNFLDNLISSLNGIQARTDRLKVVEQYLKIATNYQENMSNGYPLLQKLCLQPITEKLDDSFYLRVQDKMHRQLQKEIPKPEIIWAPSLPQDINLRLMQSAIGSSIQKHSSSSERDSNQSKIYTKHCIGSAKVKTYAMQCLMAFHPFTEEKNNSLNTFLSQTNNLSVKNQILDSLLLLQNEIVEEIKHTYQKTPQKKHLIAANLLITISEQVLAERPLTRQQSITLPQNSSFKTKELIQIKIRDLAISSVTAEKHVTLCSNSKTVFKIAKIFFEQMLLMDEFLQRKTIQEIGGMNLAKSRASASTDVHKFYNATIEEIKKQGSSPLNMHFILLRLLIKASEIT